jgi:hypothetical protein
MLWDRLKEPSTWAGFASMLAAFGVASPLASTIATAGAGIAGLLAVVIPEVSKR